jgi:hypothetical protein
MSLQTIASAFPQHPQVTWFTSYPAATVTQENRKQELQRTRARYPVAIVVFIMLLLYVMA